MRQRRQERNRPKVPSTSPSRIWLTALGVTLLACLLSFTTLEGPFIYDDVLYVRDNTFIQNPANALKLWATSYPADRPELGLYRPVTSTTFMADVALFGMNPRGFHLTNAILHGAASGLATLALVNFGMSLMGAAAAGVLFAVHPIHTEAVAWIVGRAELLAAIGCLGACLAWARFRRSGRTALAPSLLMALVCYFLALSAKETAAPLPAVLLAADALGLFPVARQHTTGPRRHTNTLASWLPYAGFALTFGLYVALRINAIGRFSMIEATTAFVGDAPGTQPISAVAIIGKYALLCLFPLNLRIDYSDFKFASVAAPPVLFGIVTVLVLAGAAWWARNRQPLVSLCIAWFLAFVLVFSNLLVPIGAVLAERFVYIASLGLCGLAGLGMATLLQGGRSRATRVAAALAGVAILITMTSLSIARTRDWQDSVRLFRTEVERSPHSEKAHLNLAVGLWERGKSTGSPQLLSEAEAVFRQGLALWPAATPTLTGDHTRLASFYANFLQERGRATEALPYYERLDAWLRQYPNLAHDVGPDFRVWYGAALEARGDRQMAREQYQLALDQRPDWIIPMRNIGQLLMRDRKYAEAVDVYRRALAIDPSFALGYVNLALALGQLSRQDEALTALNTFKRETPDSAENAYYQGYVAERLGLSAEAAAAFKRAIALNPAQNDARLALAALTKSGQD